MAVQFLGREQVLKAYDARGVDCWAVFIGREPYQTGSGRDELADCLALLGEGDTADNYALRFYPAIEDPDTIDKKTSFNGFFKFRLNPGGATVGSTLLPSRYPMDPVMAKVYEHISAKVGKVLEEEMGGKKQEPEEETWDDVIKGLIKDPAKIVSAIGAIKSLFASVPAQPAIAGVKSPVQPVRRAGAASAKQPAMGNQYDTAKQVQTEEVEITPEQEEQMERIGAALDRLEQVDPRIIEHLEKLADIAERNKPMFDILIMNLENLKV